MLAAEIEPDGRYGAGRRTIRAPVSIDARIGRDGLQRTLCKIVDLSLHGARLETYSGLKRGAMIWLTLPIVGPRAAEVVWASDFTAGCQFATALGAHDFEALLELDETLRRC